MQKKTLENREYLGNFYVEKNKLKDNILTQNYFHEYINPEKDISLSAQKVHGISNDMVKNEHNFQYYSNEIYEFIKGCDLAGFNAIKFDIPILVEELIRADIDFDFSNEGSSIITAV